ncbi:hypothetical protein [Streptomyces sp. NPDC087437]|uniref:hypothetical protein n=1 Tax=Streptomyces sp. NPDC087437 TaxID=3365789 RepID=UPI0038230524
MAVWVDPDAFDEITEQARKVRFWRTVGTAVAGLLFALGWVVAKACAVLWLAAVWVATAVKLGWQEARRGSS